MAPWARKGQGPQETPIFPKLEVQSLSPGQDHEIEPLASPTTYSRTIFESLNSTLFLAEGDRRGAGGKAPQPCATGSSSQSSKARV